jgi:cell division control protein 6
LAFNEGAIIEETINLCAAISAKSHGDARKAIELLRASAIYAEENGFSQVLPEHMNKMFDTIDADRFEKLVSGIAFHKKIILLAILKLIDHNKKTTTATEIKNTYTQISKMIAENCRARTTVANSIAELIMIGIIKEVTLRKGKGASGREIELDIPSERKTRRVAISRL